MKIKIRQTEETIKEVDVQLPLYRESSIAVYKVFSDTKCVSVHKLEHQPEILIQSARAAFILESTKDCSKERFFEIYNEVDTFITNAIFEKELIQENADQTQY